MMKRPTLTHTNRRGYTLIELMFSIAFLSALVLGATLSFVNILGLYNRAQGLTRTQSAARDAISVLSRDLGHTSEIEVKNGPLATTGASTNTVTCLKDDRGGVDRGYALLQMSDGKAHLARLQSCSSLTDYQLLVPSPVWSTSVSPSCTDAFTIEDANEGKAVEPKTWKVTVRVSHGERNPCGTDVAASDSFAASTVLTTHVVHQ